MYINASCSKACVSKRFKAKNDMEPSAELGEEQVAELDTAEKDAAA